MRYYALVVLCFLISCSAKEEKKPANDPGPEPLTLLEPKPEKHVGLDKGIALMHCLMLDRDSLAINLNGEKNSFKTISEMEIFLRSNLAAIRKEKFYIICSNDYPVKKVVDIIDVVNSQNISHEVIGLDEFFNYQ